MELINITMFFIFLIMFFSVTSGVLGQCLEGQFKCLDGACISGCHRCDGNDDCPDGDTSDELNCTRVGNCLVGEWQCADGSCIPLFRRCDKASKKDCPDGSDQIDCSDDVWCKFDHFKCSNGQCRRACDRCDGWPDCRPDGSDEEGCVTVFDGNWGDWITTSNCSKTCGDGVVVRERICNDPSPSGGGLNCLLTNGDGGRALKEIKSDICNLQACPVMWLSNSRCGAMHRLVNGMKARCDPKSSTPCCSAHGFCGQSPEHCQCPMCLDYRQGCLYNDMDLIAETLREVRTLSAWRDCESECKQVDKCMGWVWSTQTFPDETFHKVCALKGKVDKEKLIMRLGLISGLKDCPGDKKREAISSEARHSSQRKITTCSYIASCMGNKCTRGAVLKIGDSISSDNGKYNVIMQHDGNVVIYCHYQGTNKPIWSSRTDGKQVYEGLNFQQDGNLVIYNMVKGDKQAIWSSKTFDTEGDHLIIQDNGNLVMYGFHGYRVIWESKTYGMC